MDAKRRRPGRRSPSPGGLPCPACAACPPPCWPSAWSRPPRWSPRRRPVIRTPSRSTTCWRCSASPTRRSPPTGRRCCTTLRTTDLAANKGRTDLWLVALDGKSEPRRLTSGPRRRLERPLAAGRPHRLPEHALGSAADLDDRPARRRGRPGHAPAPGRRELRGRAAARRPSPSRWPSTPTPRSPRRSRATPTRRRPSPPAAPTTSCSFRRWDTWEDGKRNHVFLRPWAGTDEQAARPDARPGRRRAHAALRRQRGVRLQPRRPHAGLRRADQGRQRGRLEHRRRPLRREHRQPRAAAAA